MENQTAGEWVIDAMLQMENGIFIGGKCLNVYEVKERAKSIEKSQIIKAYIDGALDMADFKSESGSDYYKKNYGSI